MCKDPHVDTDCPAVAELMAGVAAAVARRGGAVREDVYVTAARALGAGPARIVLSHLLRNVM